jgi:hypothetical protein
VLYFIFLLRKIVDLNWAMKHGILHGMGLVVGLFHSTIPIKKQPPSSKPSPPPQLLKTKK